MTREKLTVPLMDAINFKDDFELYRARASSGGSLYGLLRRHSPLDDSFGDQLTADEGPSRQRSRSLTPRHVTFSDEKNILKVLYDYSESVDVSGEPRRHSTACIDARDVRARRYAFGSKIQMSSRRTSTHVTTTCDSEAGPSSRKESIKTSSVTYLSLPTPVHSVPNKQQSVKCDPDQPSELLELSVPSEILQRRRSFSTTPKGIVNDGDILIPTPLLGEGIIVDCDPVPTRSRGNSCPTDVTSPISAEPAVYRVLMLGGPGVGKTALTQQFMTSEYQAAQNTSFDDGVECMVPVLLDGEESIIEFIDLPYTGNLDTWRAYDVDAFVIVFSTIDRRSFQKAVDTIYDIRQEHDNHTAIVLVANKTDLVRSRIVGIQEGKATAVTYDCKYIEVSAVLNHKVDDLLVGILKQIRLHKSNRVKKRHRSLQREESGDVSCLQRARANVLGMFVRGMKISSKSCENLLMV